MEAFAHSSWWHYHGCFQASNTVGNKCGDLKVEG
jgi:hypothetical protein